MKFKQIISIIVLMGIIFSGCSSNYDNMNEPIKENNEKFNMNDDMMGESEKMAEENNKTLEDYEVATFAGGCFWCSEAAFEAETGVIEAISGYAGGDEQDATYSQVSSGKTEHREGVQVYFDPQLINYEKLLDIFWRHIDPTQEDGQFADKGFHYTTAIFYHNDSQKELAKNSKKKLNDSDKFDNPITTSILPFTTFYEAEEYHQDYYKKRSEHYERYAKGSGRKGFIEENWVEEEEEEFEMPSEEELKETLTELQYHVTREDGTERPFDNEYWDNKEEGIYVDLITGQALYSSTDKYVSGTGWPSFTKAIDDNEIVLKEDKKLFVTRIEVEAKDSGNHLGHVFDDGPVDKGGKRHCLNSASLKFIPKDKMKEKGYEKYLYLFDN